MVARLGLLSFSRRLAHNGAMADEFAKVRTAAEKDADVLASLFRESWQHAYRGIIPHSHLERMISRRDECYWRHAATSQSRPLILEADRIVAGYATFGRARRRGPYEGEIYELYMAPVYQGLGLGEHLFEAARQRLDEAGARGLVVWSLSDNLPACEFYIRRGGRAVAQTVERFGPVRLPKTAYAWQ